MSLSERRLSSSPPTQRFFRRNRLPERSTCRRPGSPAVHASGVRTLGSWDKHHIGDDDEYAPRLSSRTGGFEGLETEVDSGIFSSSVVGDDETLHMANTIQTTPAWPTFRLLDLPSHNNNNAAARRSPRRPQRTPSKSSSSNNDGGLHSVETAVAENTSYKPPQHAFNNNHNNNRAAGTSFFLFGKKRSSIGNNERPQSLLLLSPLQPQGLVPPKSPRQRRASAPSSFSAAASRRLAAADAPPAAVPAKQQQQQRLAVQSSASGTRFRLPDEPQRALQKQQHRLQHPDSPVTVDQTDAAVVLGSSVAAAPLVRPNPLVRMPSSQPSTTATEQGFELSISGRVVQDKSRALLLVRTVTPPPPPMIRRNNTNTTTTPIDVDSATPVRVECQDSPGAVRLTEDGLKRLERKSLQQCRLHELSPPLRPRSSSFMLGCVQPQQEEDVVDPATPDVDVLEGESTLVRPSDSQDGNNQHNNNCNRRKFPLVRNAASFLRRGPAEDVADFSLAPLNAMEDLDLVAPHTVVLRRVRSRSAGGKKSVVGGMFRKFPFAHRRASHDAAVVILERERQAALESRRRREFAQAQERERIERKRREYVERQRAQELCVLTSAQRASVFAGMELVEQDRIVETKKKQQQQQLPQYQQPTDHHTQSTSCSTLTATLGQGMAVPQYPVCVVCRAGPRTHMATPCRHLAYCEHCARALRRQKRGCAVCALPDVKFAAVSF